VSEPGYIPADNEARVIINGVELTPAQSMTLRVGLSLADFYCGDDEFGHTMHDLYLKRVQEIFELMKRNRSSHGASHD